jgi:hypothetical protein
LGDVGSRVETVFPLLAAGDIAAAALDSDAFDRSRTGCRPCSLPPSRTLTAVIDTFHHAKGAFADHRDELI